MTTTLYKDYLPANARIIIDYDARERVKFFYPCKWTYKKAVWSGAFCNIALFWIKIHTFFAGHLILLFFLPFLVIRAIFFPYTDYSPNTFDYTVLLIFVVPIIYFFGIPAIFTFFLARNKELLSRIVPKLAYWSAKLDLELKTKKFLKNDVFDNKLVIPCFQNVFLEYKTNKDFDKFLRKVEIVELPFEYERHNFFLFWRKHLVVNDLLFSAVFVFSKKPERGFLRVEFA